MGAKLKISVILFNGPPFTGKEHLLTNFLSEKYSCLCPEELFEENPSYGLRDVALKAVEKLKKGGKVIIDSDNCTASSRQSYISLIKKKIPNIHISVYEILPKYGCQQLFWAREYDLAARFSHKVETKHTQLRDGQIEKWFASEEDIDVKYRRGIVEAPKEVEGVNVHRLKLHLTCETINKLEVPALFIQWDILQALTKDGRLSVGAVTKVLKLWSSICSCGRIIVIYDGMSLRSGVKSSSQTCDEIHSTMKQLTQSFHDMPVFVYAVSNPAVAGGFVVPPRPGLIAYLQRRHCLDLHSKLSVYLYESQQHLKMAEKAGIPYLKGSRVLEHPSLVTSRHAAVIPPIPEMLKTMEVKEMIIEECPGAITPLFDVIDNFRDGYIKQDLPFGRTEYLFADDVDTIKRYQTLYASKAAKVNEADSRIAVEINNQYDANQQLTSPLETPANVSRISSESRDLPKWMIQRDESHSSVKSSVEFSRSDSTSSTDVKIKKTVYVMTERELTEVAMDILQQAGRTELVEQFQSRQQAAHSMKFSCITSNKNKKIKQHHSYQRTKHHEKETIDNSHSNATTKDVASDNTKKTSLESKERISERDSESWHSENESAHKHHINVRDTVDSHNLDIPEQSDAPLEDGVNDDKPYCVSEIVTNVLDDLTCTQKTSGAKRKTRLKAGVNAVHSPAKRQVKRDLRELHTPEYPEKPQQRMEDSKAENKDSHVRKEMDKDSKLNSSTEVPRLHQTVKSLDKLEDKDSLFMGKERTKRKTPDLRVLDEIFG